MYYEGPVYPDFFLQTALARLRKGLHCSLCPHHSESSVCRVNSLAKTCAWQLQRTDVRVNSICPGLIETGMTIGVFDYARQRGTSAKIGQINPSGRYGVPEGIL